MRLRSLGVLAALAVCAASCSQEDGYTDQQRSCITQRYPTYDSRQLRQCVDVMPGLHEGYHRYLQHVVQAQGRKLVSPRDARFDGNRTLHSA